ncbi:MAG TPA: hypothetical protein PKA41_12715 [Verrucomicrobiota bacterium]|nr:hypothetical protein [Verrucomicrobiota bacterium]
MIQNRKGLVSRFFGKIGWFYIGTVISVALIVTLVRLAYGQVRWDWADMRGHMMVIMGIFVVITFGPFVVFDFAAKLVDSPNYTIRPRSKLYFLAGLMYPLLLTAYGFLIMLLNSHLIIFLFMVSLFALTFLLPWLFVKLLSKKMNSDAPTKASDVPRE